MQRFEWVDDIDGTQAEVTTIISLDGKFVQLDLSDENHQHLVETMSSYMEAGREVPASRRTPSAAVPKTVEDGPKIRAWARSTGRQVSDKGRIPEWIVRDYYVNQDNDPKRIFVADE